MLDNDIDLFAGSLEAFKDHRENESVAWFDKESQAYVFSEAGKELVVNKTDIIKKRIS